MEGGFIQQDNRIARATCSCGMPPLSGIWSPFCVCVGIWSHGSHGQGGTMRGSDTVVRDIPKSPCAHWRRLQCDSSG